MRLGTTVRIWKRIDELENMEQYKGYEVSNLGEVRSLYYNNTYESKILKPGVNNKGYLYVVLNANSKQKAFKVHRLVALAFIPNPDNYPCVNHIDENKQNNNVNNLEFCTYEYNNNYGTHNKRVAEAHKGKKHNQETINKISESRKKKIYCIELDKVFDSVTEAANILNINQSNISSVCKGKRKTCGGYRFEYYNK